MPNRISPFISEAPPARSGALEKATARSCTVVCGSRKILAIREEIRALRMWTGQEQDATTDPDWFVRMIMAQSCNPWIVLLSEQGRLVAAMVLAERRIFGLPSGYMKAEGMDQGFLICRPEQRSAYFPLLLNGLFSRRSALIAYVAQLAISETAHAGPADPSALVVEWKQALYHYRLRLSETMEKTLASYGVHTRRNLRYYLRKARAEGCRFIAELPGEQRLEVVKSLRSHATHGVSVESARLREAAIQSVPNSFAMGVQEADGSWVSYLTGWRREGQTFVCWQMNLARDKSSSMGTAMRSFLMEEEIARGATEIVFLGGSSEVFKRCCEVDPSVHLFMRRRGLRGWALKALLERTVVSGHPLRTKRHVIQST
jgi:hypothetical protein